MRQKMVMLICPIKKRFATLCSQGIKLVARSYYDLYIKSVESADPIPINVCDNDRQVQGNPIALLNLSISVVYNWQT